MIKKIVNKQVTNNNISNNNVFKKQLQDQANMMFNELREVQNVKLKIWSPEH